MGLLVKREYLKPRAQRLAEEAALRVGPGSSYYTLTMGSGPVGYVASTIDTTPSGITVQSNTVLDIRALGSVQKTSITTVINLTRTLRLVSFHAELNSEAAKNRAGGRGG